MLNEIEILLKVQEKDLRIMALAYRLKKNPEIVNKAGDRLKEAENALKDKEDMLRKLQVERKNSEIQVESNNEKIAKLDSQAGSVRDNKTYKAIQNEILDLKARISLIEDTMLENMEKCDEVGAQIKDLREKAVQAKKALGESETRAKKENEEIEKEIKDLESLKTEIEKNLRPEILSQYRRLLNNKKDTVVVPSKNGSCGGCFMSLTPQCIMKLKSEMQIVTCESCQRILYWES
ncbi:MAG: C4-type zinc ribbon domain-containing protein [bacterium]|nr:C4-type zinc ribbon domain-containing protein [bacterium]